MAKGGLGKWFGEKWIDVKTGKPCVRTGKNHKDPVVKEKLERDPHYIPIMGIETEGGSGGGVQWIPFMNTLKEMDYVAVKDDLRDRICAFYGVSKIFQNDTTTSGCLNNEGHQLY